LLVPAETISRPDPEIVDVPRIKDVIVTGFLEFFEFLFKEYGVSQIDLAISLGAPQFIPPTIFDSGAPAGATCAAAAVLTADRVEKRRRSSRGTLEEER